MMAWHVRMAFFLFDAIARRYSILLGGPASKKSALETSKKRASSLYINGYETSKDRGLCAGEFSEGHNTRVLRNRKLRKVAGEERGSILCGVSLDWSSGVQNSCRTRANSRPTNWLR